MVGDFIIRKHSARTLALLVRSPARPGRARGLCGVAIAPLSARSLWSHAVECSHTRFTRTLAFAPPRLRLDVAFSPTLPLVARALKRCRLTLILNHVDLLYHSY